MRFSKIAIVAICAISLSTFAGTRAEETKSKRDEGKIEMDKSNTTIASLTAGGNASSSQNPTPKQNKTTKAGSEQTQGDNVQGLSTSDRRYRYHD